jgi:hypothetical protein
MEVPMDEVNKCPKCGFENNQLMFSTCPKCGIIISKYYTKEQEPTYRVPQAKDITTAIKVNSKQDSKTYIDTHLMIGEHIIHRGYMHKMPIILFSVAIAPTTLVLFGIFSALKSTGFANILLLGGIGTIGILWLALKRTEMAVTNKRVIIKKGILATRSLEMVLSKIESVIVDKGLIGNIFDYGDIVVTGSGGTKEILKWVKAPIEFRNAVNKSLGITA